MGPHGDGKSICDGYMIGTEPTRSHPSNSDMILVHR
jgi:hypothetical protein